MAELLGIPDTVTQVALLPVAYYTGDTFHPPRPARREITFFNRWKADDLTEARSEPMVTMPRSPST